MSMNHGTGGNQSSNEDDSFSFSGEETNIFDSILSTVDVN